MDATCHAGKNDNSTERLNGLPSEFIPQSMFFFIEGQDLDLDIKKENCVH